MYRCLISYRPSVRTLSKHVTHRKGLYIMAPIFHLFFFLINMSTNAPPTEQTFREGAKMSIITAPPPFPPVPINESSPFFAL